MRKEAVNSIYNLFKSDKVTYDKFLELLKDIFEDERELSWRVKYSAIEVLYKCLAKLRVEFLEDPELISLLQVYFDVDAENTSALHNIIGLDCIFRWAKKLFISKIEEKLEKNNLEETKQDHILAENFIRLADQIILLFTHKSTHLLVKEKYVLGMSKIITIPVVNKDLKYMNSKLLSEFKHQILKHPNKYWMLLKTFVEDIKSRLIRTKTVSLNLDR